MMGNLYWSGGGPNGRGGPVSGTDLAIFEHEQGGAGVRIKTCIEDVVVVIFTNSSEQLHSCVLNLDDFAEDETAWTSRVIPYIQKGVFDWMKNNPNGKPFTAIP